jgi:hypothetical protein
VELVEWMELVSSAVAVWDFEEGCWCWRGCVPAGAAPVAVNGKSISPVSAWVPRRPPVTRPKKPPMPPPLSRLERLLRGLWPSSNTLSSS